MVRTFETIQKELAQNLKEARLRAGVSQEALALAADVDRTYVSQIERAVSNPSVSVIVKLATALAIDIEELVKSSK